MNEGRTAVKRPSCRAIIELCEFDSSFRSRNQRSQAASPVWCANENRRDRRHGRLAWQAKRSHLEQREYFELGCEQMPKNTSLRSSVPSRISTELWRKTAHQRTW